MLVFLGLSGAALAAGSLDGWRDEVARTRMLAENDVPRAIEVGQLLLKEVPADATPADRARALNVLARAENYRGLIDRAEQHAKQALALAKEHGDKVGQTEAHLNLVLSSINLGKIKELTDATVAAVESVDGVVDRPDLQVEAMHRMSMLYRRFEKLDESVTLAMQALEMAKRSNDPLALTYAHHGMAISFALSKRPEEMREHYREMLKQAQAARSGMLEAAAKVGLGTEESNYAQAESYIREALVRYRSIGANYSLNNALYKLADILHSQGKHADALKTVDEEIAIFERFPSKIGMWYALNLRSSINQAMGRFATARADAERSLGLAKEIGLPLYMSTSAKRVAEAAAAAGDHRGAYRYAAEAIAMADKASQEHGHDRILELAQRYETESEQRKIRELNAELAQHDLRQRWMWTVIAAAVVIVFILGYFTLRLRRSREEIRQLNASLEQRVQDGVAELRQQTIYLRTLLDTLPSMVWMKDKDSRYLVVNQTIAQACGQTVSSMVGKTDLELWPRELAEGYRADDQDVMRARQLKIVEEAVADKQGEQWVETHKAPVLDEDGTLLGTVGIAFDISKRKAAEAAREAALEEAERLARVRSEFLAQMSHELRTPLNGILGYAQILQRDAGLSERQSTGLTVIRQSGEHLLALINDILDFARIEAGKVMLSDGDIQLEKFLNTIAGIVGIRAEQKNIGFKLELAGDLPGAIRGDEQRLRQVLLNLMSNAVKFTERGEVALRVSIASGSHMRFEVTDTGVGIAPDRLERIFRPFEQAGDRQRWVEGTGLGLAISRQYVRLMGSDIQVDSCIGVGSAFHFDLALVAAETRGETVAAVGNVTGYCGQRRMVLVVDDVADNRGLLVEFLGQLGFDTLAAASGREAIAAAKSNRPDLILMDIAMPDMDGLEATRHLRQLQGLETVPILAISASASGSDESRCLAGGMSAFLPKPVDLRQLQQRIGALLRLDWTYVLPEAQIPEKIETFDSDRLPPREEMDALHQLALQGNMNAIMKWAERIAGLDDRYRPMADHLRHLARGYESQAILRLVEQHLDEKRTR
ncbi:MAG TPA: ATP-binding protein [Gallionella sp.]|nr:ATP-binding protein [Gallionella sp.]